MGRAREIADLIGGTTPDIILKTSDGAILNLQTSDTTVTADSVLGAINFQAPDEASGTDSILIGSKIEAIAEGTFSASSNATSLVFSTASSAAAGTVSGKMTFTSGGNLIIKDTDTADGSSPTITLQSGDTDIAANDVLGSINFQAPDEGTGTDAILVGAGIEAVSEGDFSSSSNATKLVFKTGASEAAASKMTLSSGGVLNVDGGITVDNITIDGTEIDLSSGDLTLDSGGDIILDADGANIIFKDGGTSFGEVKTNSTPDHFIFTSLIQDKDYFFQGNDGGTIITALQLDMSDAGAATLNNGLTLTDGDLTVASGHGISFAATSDGTTMGSELFDDYEEGTWTPAIVGTSNTPTFYNQTGRYTKIGRSVTVQCFLQTNVAPTFSDTATEFQISGVPFNLLAIGYTGGQGTVNTQALGYIGGDNNNNAGSSTGGAHLTCGINADERLIFHVTGSGQSRGQVENSGTTSGFILEATLTYFTDA